MSRTAHGDFPGSAPCAHQPIDVRPVIVKKHTIDCAATEARTAGFRNPALKEKTVGQIQEYLNRQLPCAVQSLIKPQACRTANPFPSFKTRRTTLRCRSGKSEINWGTAMRCPRECFHFSLPPCASAMMPACIFVFALKFFFSIRASSRTREFTERTALPHNEPGSPAKPNATSGPHDHPTVGGALRSKKPILPSLDP